MKESPDYFVSYPVELITKVGKISKEVQEKKLKWNLHVMRRKENYVVRRVMGMKVQGGEEVLTGWLDSVRGDIREAGLSGEEVYDRATWRRISSNIDPT